MARLDARTQSLLHVASAVGRDVEYRLLAAVAALPERDVRESLRQAVEHGVLVAEQATNSFRFRHALLAEAIYSTILPGEREDLHARLADELAHSGAAAPAELAPHWAAARPQPRCARGFGRRGAPVGGGLRLGGGARPPRTSARAVGDRSRRARALRTRPRRALLVDSGARQPNRPRATCGRAHAASDRAGPRERPAARRAPLRPPRPLPPRERTDGRRARRLRARGRARAGTSHHRRNARGRSPRSRTG